MKNFRIISISLLALTVISTASCQKQGSKKSEKGFKQIFDGKTLNGWEGDPVYWKVENGSLVGEITPETILKRNTFIIWRGGAPKNFELVADVKITKTGNSGINYRSEELLPDLPFAMKGYQADIDGANRYTGQNYEERGRTTLAYRGQITKIKEQTDPTLKTDLKRFQKRNAWQAVDTLGVLGNLDSLKSKIKSEDWNTVKIVAKGNRLQHFVNDVLMADVTDADLINGKSEGLIGVQVHVGPPMKVEYRNIRIKELK
ncbi:MAG: DUF1080 domain-containing protein [Bacteroidota bacterium]